MRRIRTIFALLGGRGRMPQRGPRILTGIVKLSQKIVHLCSKERTIEDSGLSRAPVFSLFPPPQLSSREGV
jgi:hypothetical protein